MPIPSSKTPDGKAILDRGRYGRSSKSYVIESEFSKLFTDLVSCVQEEYPTGARARRGILGFV
jgi:hypothetical protein